MVKLLSAEQMVVDLGDRSLTVNNQMKLRITIAAMASLLCRLQILVGLEFGQSIPTVVHTVRELQL